MAESAKLVKLYGTDERAEAMHRVELGELSFLLGQEAIRRISWKGVELVRAIAWPIRDPSWITLIPDVAEESFAKEGDSAAYDLRFTVEGALDCRLKVRADAAGKLVCDLAMTALTDFRTNRAGFTVLHPIEGVAGSPVTVTHSDGAVEESVFPRLISPDQPVMDISGLRHTLDGATVDIVFAGEIFEMEDQRNWSDASYKTYCVPLVFPFTYEIGAGESRTQRIEVGFLGEVSIGSASGAAGLVLSATDETAPAIGLALQPGWQISDGSRAVVGASGAGFLSARITPGTPADFLRSVRELATELKVGSDIEIVLPDADKPADSLTEVAARLSAAGIQPVHLTALQEGYMASHQPSGPWPDGPRPAQVADAARAAFPNALIGGGMLTNFTEFNRCPPDPAHCDFITHSTTAIVHAGDDLSVIETLEALPQIFESANEIGGDRAYRLGLVSIGMRTNPYGADVADNRAQIRQTMARDDPRQRGLFAAAWAVGALASTVGGSVDALCLAAPTGPFGIAYEPGDIPQPLFDGSPDAAVYPIFHVFRAAAAMAGEDRLAISGLPSCVAGYGADTDGGSVLLVANISTGSVGLSLGREGSVLVLDEASFAAAIGSPDWLESSSRLQADRLDLGPYAVAFIRFGGG